MKFGVICILAFGFLLHFTKGDDTGIGYWLCHGEKHGTLIPNPFDCESYFVCDGAIPQIKYCDSNLHFDPIKQVCNWPQDANCQLEIVSSTPRSSTHTQTQTQGSTWPQTHTQTQGTTWPHTHTQTQGSTGPHTGTQTPTPTQTQTQTQTQPPTHTRTPPPTTITKTTVTPTSEVSFTTRTSTTVSTTEPLCSTYSVPTGYTTTIRPIISPFMGAYDQNTGLPIPSMTGYNPYFVQCLHNGLYFIPHPFKCDTYFICAEKYLHLHHCGSGVHWNYKKEQCEISVISRCYYKEAVANGTITTKPPPTSEFTMSTTTLPSTTLKPKPPTPPTPPTPSNKTTTAAISTTKNHHDDDKEVLPECPKDRRAYYPHLNDCRKYYNCIGGTPILTICPNNLYWNEIENSCSLPEYTDCKSYQKNLKM